MFLLILFHILIRWNLFCERGGGARYHEHQGFVGKRER